MGGTFSLCETNSDDALVLNHFGMGKDLLESAQLNAHTNLDKSIDNCLLALEEFEQARVKEECEASVFIQSSLTAHQGLVNLYRRQKNDHEAKKHLAKMTQLEKQLAEIGAIDNQPKGDEKAETKSVESKPKKSVESKPKKSVESKREYVFPEYVKPQLKERLDPNKPIEDTVFLVNLYHELDDNSLQKGLLRDLAREIVECFGHRVVKDESIIQEVIPLVQMGDITITQSLLKEFLRELEQTRLLEIPIVKGLGDIIEQTNAELFHSMPNEVDGIEEKKQAPIQPDDNTLVQILEVLFAKFKAFHQAQGKESNQTSLLTMVRALSHVLDAMLGLQVSGLNRESLYMPVHDALKNIADSDDAMLQIEAARALQALTRMQSDESKAANAFRRMHHIIQAAVNIKSVVFDFNLLGLVDLYDNLQGAFTFCKGKADWYEKLRYCQCLIKLRQFRELEDFLSREVKSLKIPEFQLGIIHYLDEILHTDNLVPVEKQGCLALFKNMFYCSLESNISHRAKSIILSSQEIFKVQDQLLGKMVDYVREPALRDLVMLELFEIRDTVQQDWQKQLVRRHRLAHIEYMKEDKLNEKTLPDQLLKEAKKIVGRNSISWKLQSLKTTVLNDENISQELIAYIDPMGHQRGKEEERYDLLNQTVLQEFLGLKAVANHSAHMVLEEKTIAAKFPSETKQADAKWEMKEQKREHLETKSHEIKLATANVQQVDHPADDSSAKRVAIINAKPQETQDKVLLLLGGAGTGKSTFGRFLEHYLWEHYQSDGYVPLFISLTMAQQVNRFIVETHLREKGFSKDQIEEIRLRHKLVVILDGYDEINQHINLYASNQLDRWPGIKVMISCRPEHLEGQNYQQLFIPISKQKGSSFGGLRESFVALFDDRQVEAYLNKYVTISRQQAGAAWTGWPNWQAYHDKIKSIQGLEELIHTPFMLKIIVDVLPGLLRKKAEDKALGQTEQIGDQIHRVELYQAFTEQWYANEKSKLDAQKLALAVQTMQPIYEFQVGGEITRDYQAFAESLAGYMFEHSYQMLTYHVKWHQQKIQKELIKQELDCFFGFNPATSLIRKGCPLKCQGNSYMFIHKSLWEYYVAMRIYRETLITKHLLSKGRLLLSRFWELEDDSKNVVDKTNRLLRWILIQRLCKRIQRTKDLEQNFPLHFQIINLRLLSEEPMILKFLSELAKKDKAFKRILLGWLGLSQYDDRYQTGAANAITILNLAKMPFSGMNLSNIRIPGADLSYALLHRVKLRQANLANGNLYNAYLDDADITGAQFKDVFISDRYGTLLGCNNQEESSDGQQMIFYQGNQKDNVYWYTAHGGGSPVTVKHKYDMVTFSNDGKQMVLFDSEPGSPAYWYDVGTQENPIKIGGDKIKISIAQFSSDSQHVVFCASSNSGSAYLYNTQSKKELFKTKLYTHEVEFSPDSQQVVFLGLERCAAQKEENNEVDSSGQKSYERYVAYWYDARDQKLIQMKSGIKSVVFSSDSQQIVFYDNEYDPYDIREAKEKDIAAYWYNSSQPKDPIRIEGCINQVQFSSDNQHIICWSTVGEVVRVYDVKSKALLVNLANIDGFQYMDFSSPQDRHVAFFANEMVYWFDRQHGGEPTKIEGEISEMVCSPDIQQIIFFNNNDGNKAYWYDCSNMATLLIVDGQFESIAFSSNSQYVVFYTKENTAILYDVAHKEKLFETNVGINAGNFSPDDQQIVFFDTCDKSIAYWYDCSHAAKPLTIDNQITGVKFSANSQQVVFYNDLPKSVAIWYDAKHKTELFKVGEGINQVVFSPNNQWVVFYNNSKGQIAYYCDTSCKRPPIRIEDKIDAVEFSPDGRYTVLYGKDTDGTYLLKTNSSEISRVSLMGISKVVFTPDPQFILLAHEKSCYHWNVEEQTYQMLYEASSRITDIQIQVNPVLEHYLICTMEQGFYICQDWKGRSCQPKRLHASFEGHSSRVVALKSLHELVFSISEDQEIGVWQIHPSVEPQLIKFIKTMGWDHKVITSPDKQQIILYNGENEVSYWYDRILGLEPIQVTNCVAHPEFSPDSQQVVFHVQDNLAVEFLVWYSRDQITEPLKIEFGMTNVLFSPDSQQVVFFRQDNVEDKLSFGAYWYNVSCKTDRIKIDDFITGVQFSPDSQVAVFYSQEGESAIYLYDVPHQKMRLKIDNQKNTISRVAFSPDSQQLVLCSDTENATSWYQLRTSDKPIILEGNVADVIFSADSQQLFFYDAGYDGAAYWYDLSQGIQLTKIKENINSIHLFANDQQVIFYSTSSSGAYWYHRDHKNKCITIEDQFEQVLVSPDNQQIVLYGNQIPAYWYNQRYGVEPIKIEDDQYGDIVFSPDSRQMILYNGNTGIVYWYDTSVKQEPEKIEKEEITNVLFSYDSRYVVFYNEYGDKPAYCYEVNSKKNILKVEGSITSVKFFLNGQHIVFHDNYGQSIAYWYDIQASQLSCIGKGDVKFEFVDPHYLFVYGLQSSVINLSTKQKVVLPMACEKAVFIPDLSHTPIGTKISYEVMPQYLLTSGYRDRTLRLWNLFGAQGPLLKWCSDGLILSTNGLIGVDSAIDLNAKNKRVFHSEETILQKAPLEHKEKQKQAFDIHETKNAQETKKLTTLPATFFKPTQKCKADIEEKKTSLAQQTKP